MKSILESIPNIGPSMAHDLISLGINHPEDLRGKDADDLYIQLCKLTNSRQDPCVHDTLASAIHFSETGECRVWWSFTPARKARLGDCRGLYE